MNPSLRIAVDIGGTFTDVAVADSDGTIIATNKTATTPDNPTAGAMNGVRRALATIDAEFSDVTGFIHGTTLATNALIERRGAVVANITTQGFRDILEIAYERRYSQYDIDIEKPDLIVPRSRCFTLPERVDFTGNILTPLDESALDPLLERLDACGAQAVAVCFLHAYANPTHEQRLRKLLSDCRPNLHVSLSSDISPEAREFERLCTTVANAYVQPLMATYLAEFAEEFSRAGLTCPILMMTSGGGMTTLETARSNPIRLVESGPSGGAVLAAKVARDAGLKRVLSFDMGGTTAKLCLIDDGLPQMSRQFEISRAARFIKGSGMPARIPVVEMIEIGAGGGSMASVDILGRLQVGPESAGADPGPAAFGKGGTGATVTDADVVLGYIDPDAFAEGRLMIDRDAAAQAIRNSVARSLSLDVEEAAHGVCQIVDENMASAGRMHAVESGKGLEDRVMIAFGGNGPLHATRVARRAGVRSILVPPDPGVGSAVGFLHAPVSFEIVRSKYATLETLDSNAVNSLINGMIAEAEAVVRAGAPEGDFDIHRAAFMRYRGQGHEIEIRLPDRALHDADKAELLTRFETEYRAQYSRPVPGMVVEILNWAVRVASRNRFADGKRPIWGGGAANARRTTTIACERTGKPVECDVYHRAQLPAGVTLRGPAVIVEPQTTTLVGSGFDVSVDPVGNLRLERSEREVVQS